MGLFASGLMMHEHDTDPCQDCLPGYPKPCPCGGRVHAEAGDLGYETFFQCDGCHSIKPNLDTPAAES